MIKVIFLDAVGTLFDVQGSVGAIYAAQAKTFGVGLSANLLNLSFQKAFKAIPPLKFSQSVPADLQLQRMEEDWWRQIVVKTFEPLVSLEEFSNFDRFFKTLFAYFSTAEAWYVYPEVIATLQQWKQEEIELGIISNFDSRLPKVLEALQLSSYFSSVTLSTQVGSPKPEAEIFARALEKHHGCAYQAIHIGDQYEDDFQGANLAGLQGVWLRRSDDWKKQCQEKKIPPYLGINRLNQLNLEHFQ